ncbi:MAG: CDP-alcohol phosphatidyltransferase family protein [Phycisphaerae bacterium]|nr:CDP-alcohol phosphatidyltransferase family protein [Phycisphaerae bacterium]
MSTTIASTRSTPASAPTVSPWLALMPNVLTVSRLALAAGFFLSLELARRPIHDEWWLSAAAAIFVVAALTDAVDGWLARRWNAVSIFGRIMDPVADKILIIGAFIYLAGPAFLTTVQTKAGVIKPVQATAVDAWMVVVILLRELVVTSIRGLLEGQGTDFSASLAGKAKMLAQSIAVPTVLGLVALGSKLTGGSPYDLPRPPMPDWINLALRLVVWSTMTLTVLSVVPYVVRAHRLVRDANKP